MLKKKQTKAEKLKLAYEEEEAKEQIKKQKAELTPLNLVKKQKKKDRLVRWYRPQCAYLINMELRNGDHTTFLINTAKDHFTYMKAKYVIDSNLKHYNINAKMYSLDYHQDFSLPIKRVFNVSSIKKAIKSTDMIDVELATNPSTLEGFVESNVAKQVMKSAGVEEFLKVMRTMVIVNVILSALTFMIIVWSTGMLQGLKVPGMG